MLTLNAFVCSVKSCSEVSSRGCLVTRDDAFVCSVISYLEVKRVVFENWFTTPPKGQKLGGKVSEKNFISSRDGAEKSIETSGDEKPKKTHPNYRTMPGPLSGLQRNALASLVRFVTYITKQTRDASALRWRTERGPGIVP